MKQQHTRFNTATSPLHSLLNGLLKYAAIVMMAVILGAMPLRVKAQTTYIASDAGCVLGTGTSGSYEAPINLYYRSYLTQQIYTASEIGMSGTIGVISFQYNSSSSITSQEFSIYLGLVSKSTFSSTTDWVPINDMSLVWTGTITTPNTAGAWVTINLDYEFYYDNSYNLVICCYDNDASVTYPGSSSTTFRYTSTSSNYRTLYARSDSTPPTISSTGSRTYNRPNLKLRIGSKTVTTCSGTFYDSGGSSGNYDIYEDYVWTFQPSTSGAKIQLDFTAFGTESGYDFMEIYDGTSTSANLIDQYTDTYSPGVVTATNSSGALTCYWHSDVSNVDIGFAANISCVTPQTLTFSASPSGSGTVYVEQNGNSVSSGASFMPGTILDIYASENSGYVFSNWTVSGTGASVDDPNDPNTTLTMGSANTTLTANFVEVYLMNNNNSVTTCSGYFYDSGGPTGSYSNTSYTKTFYPGTSGKMVRLAFSSFSTESCCDYLAIYNGTSTSAPQIGSNHYGTDSPGTVTASNCDGALTVRFYSDGSVTDVGWAAAISCENPTTATLNFSASPSGGGTVSVTSCGSNISSGSSVMQGSTCNISASANSGYVFTGWTVSGTGASVANTSSTSTTLTMGTANTTLTANFVAIPANSYCSTATSLPCGTTNMSGTTVNTPGEPHGIPNHDISNYGVWYTFTGDGSRTTVSVTSSVDMEMVACTGSCNSLSFYKYYDDPPELTFDTENGTTYYIYVAYYSSSGTSSETGAFTISRTCIPRYTITLAQNPSNCGTVSVYNNGNAVSSGSYVFQGDVLDISVTPNTGYIFTSWSVSGSGSSVASSTSSTTTLTIGSANVTLTANFTAVYQINVSATPSNGGSVSGGGTFTSGQSCTVTATPNSGYCFLNWTNNDNGTVMSTNFTYSFTVSQSLDLVANFIVMDANSISVSGNTVTCGSSATLTASGLTGVTYNWYSDSACTQLIGTGATLTTPTLYDNTTYYVKAVGGTSLEEGAPSVFSYTGGVQSYNVPSGAISVTMEVWGAQGGTYSSSYTGGKGGYAVGTLNNPSGTLYVVVGGQGSSGAGTSSGASGGYNGGGRGGNASSSTYASAGSGGGGATHIATSSGTLSSLSSSSVLLVAGGGGGASGASMGGSSSITPGSTVAAGGAAGLDGGRNTSNDYNGYGGTAGTTSGGGTGGSASSATTTNTDRTYYPGGGGGGGAGYYGGGGGGGGSTSMSGYQGYAGSNGSFGAGGAGGNSASSATAWFGGGGGSGAGGASYASSVLQNGSASNGNVTFASTSGSTETGHEGNGYARITPYVMEQCETDAKAVTVTVTPLSANDITVTGATVAYGNSTTLTASGLTGVTYYWYSDAACTQLITSGPTMTTPTLTSTTSYYVKAVKESLTEGTAQTFDYTGNVQSYTIPSGASSVKLEVWGAQGGDATYGGKGGYSVGTLNNLSGVSNLYVYVGQQPSSTTGGWNGGGGYTSWGTSGGGATDISLHNNTYNTTNHYNDRIIVAGGGGGRGYSSTYGGAGGGLNGIAGGVGSATSGGGGASQTSGGSGGTYSSNASYAGEFGTASTNSSHNGGGGGGGWYGGGSGVGAGTDAGGGGGSGYVWTSSTASSAPSGYSVSTSYYLTDAQTIAGNTSFSAPGGGTETGHSGNGYARITPYVIELGCESEVKTVTVIVTCTLTYDKNHSSATGTMTDSNSPYGYGSTVTVLANGFTAPSANYIFGIWNTNANGSGTSYAAGSTFSITANTTLYAQWAPIHIANATQWNEFSTVVNEGFSYSGQTVYLDADITVTTTAPVGTSSKPFQGTFEGNGHVVNYTHSANVTDKGLFGYVSGSANIQNVIVNATLSGTSTSVGAVVGTFASSGTISNVEGAGTISSSSTNAGGLVGNMTNGTIHSSFAVATLSGSATNKGGLVGSNSGNLYNSYSNATYSGSATKGGLVGTNSGTVENCYAAGIASGVSAFAGSNSGTIQYCYANATGSGYVGGGSGTLSSHGTYASITNGIKHLDYMYRDNAITLASGTSTYVPSTVSYANNHTPKWNGLVSALNQWVTANPHGLSGLTSWHRPLTTNINGDLPVLAFPKDSTLVTTNGKYLQYSASLDRLLYEHASNTAYVFHYGNATGVTQTPGADVHVYVQEDAVLLQATSPDPGAFNNTTVGVTFDNSDHGTHAQDFWGNTLNYDWHLMSTPLCDAKIGTRYSTYTGSGSTYTGVDIASMTNSYFPNGLPMALHQSIMWDFYSYYEPEYHWINLKRNKNNHYHVDNGDNIQYDAWDQGVNDNQSDTCRFTPGKGYMMAISQNTYMNNTGTLNRGNVSIKLTNQEPSDLGYARGWNLVGNPYQAYLNLNSIGKSPIYTYDADRGLYLPFAATASENPEIVSQYIHPHQAFFVHADTDGETMTFTPSMATTMTNAASYYREDAINYPLVNLFAENSAGQRDLTVVEFHRPEIGGAQKYLSMTTAPFSIAAHHGGTGYGILFSTDDMERIPVHFKTDEDDNITLTWNTYNGTFSQLYLVDNILGVTYDMLSHDSYLFMAHADDYASRFYITYECTGVDEEGDDSGSGYGNGTFAYISHGNIVVDTGDGLPGKASLQLVDVLGRVLYSTECADGTCTISTTGLAKGVYMLRLTKNKTMRTQKIVVR